MAGKNWTLSGRFHYTCLFVTALHRPITPAKLNLRLIWHPLFEKKRGVFELLWLFSTLGNTVVADLPSLKKLRRVIKRLWREQRSDKILNLAN